jgi:hypothetical protein
MEHVAVLCILLLVPLNVNPSPPPLSWIGRCVPDLICVYLHMLHLAFDMYISILGLFLEFSSFLPFGMAYELHNWHCDGIVRSSIMSIYLVS